MATPYTRNSTLRLDQFQGPAGATGSIVRSAPPLDRPRVGPYDGAVALVDLAVAIVDLLATRVAERIPRRLRPVGSLRLFDLRHRELTIDEVRREPDLVARLDALEYGRLAGAEHHGHDLARAPIDLDHSERLLEVAGRYPRR